MLNALKRFIRNRVIAIAAFCSIMAGFVIIFTGISFYKQRVAGSGIDETLKYHNYRYHYALITEEKDEFWEAIYKGALEKGKEYDTYVEKIGSNLSESYPLTDLMKIAIASKVDGIIIEPNGDEEIIRLIDDARDQGIPVITVLKDAPSSNRISFVGINSYNQGQAYGSQVMEVINEDTENVTILLDSYSKDSGQDIIYTTIREMIGDDDIKVETASINTQSTFSSQESIRNILMSTINPPDILVCLSVIDTLSANQAVVDYNMVGDIDIIGYYDSELILSAIKKDIIHSTMTIDAKQMGATCVEALVEYRVTQQVSDYFTVDISIINSSNLDEHMKDKYEEQ